MEQDKNIADDTSVSNAENHNEAEFSVIVKTEQPLLSSRKRIEKMARSCKTCTDCDVHCRHLKGKVLLCKTCKKEYRSVQGLKRHICKQETHSCCVCQKKFVSTKALRIHLRTHSETWFYSCVNCEKPFTPKSKWHLCIDTDGGPYFCDICEKRFQNFRSLNQHLKWHVTENKTCKVCKQLFKNKCHLKQHVCGKDFICETCGKILSSQSLLDIHISTNCGIKPFDCRMCRRNFNRKGDLIQHFRRTHNKELVIF